MAKRRVVDLLAPLVQLKRMFYANICNLGLALDRRDRGKIIGAYICEYRNNLIFKVDGLEAITSLPIGTR